MQDQGAPGGNSPSGAQTPNRFADSTLGWPSAPSSSVSWSLHLPSSTPPRVMCLTERHTNLTVGVGIMFAHNPLHGSGRAVLPHPALALGNDAHATQGIGMTDRRQWQPA